VREEFKETSDEVEVEQSPEQDYKFPFNHFLTDSIQHAVTSPRLIAI